MAAKTARSKATPTKENGVRVEEGLSLFKSDKFDADAYVQSKCSINEKVRIFFPLIRSLVRILGLNLCGIFRRFRIMSNILVWLQEIVIVKWILGRRLIELYKDVIYSGLCKGLMLLEMLIGLVLRVVLALSLSNVDHCCTECNSCGYTY